MNLTLRIVIKEVVVEEVIEGLVHVAGDLRTNLTHASTRMCLVDSIVSLIVVSISSVTTYPFLCVLVKVLEGHITYDLVRKIETIVLVTIAAVGTLVTHKALVLTNNTVSDFVRAPIPL